MMRRSLAASLVLAWCVASLTQTTAGYSRPDRPEHRGNQGPSLPPQGGTFRLLRPLLSLVGQRHQTQKRQAFPSRPQQVSQQLNIPAIGFRRRQHEQQRGGNAAFTPQFPRQQPQIIPRPVRQQPQQQQQQQQQKRRFFQSNSWPKPATPAAQPTFKSPQKSSQKRLDDPFPKGFVNFGTEFSKHFPKLPGSFESNFGYNSPASFHSPAGADEYNEPAPTSGESQDYDEPATNQDEPASSDYEDPSPATQSSRYPDTFRYPSPPRGTFQRPSHSEPSEGPSYYNGKPTTQSNYEDENADDYGTSQADEVEGEGDNDNQSQNDAEEPERPPYRPQYNSYAQSSPGSYNNEPEPTDAPAQEDSEVYNERPQYGGYRRPQVSHESGEAAEETDDDRTMHEPPRKNKFRRPQPSYNTEEDEDIPQYARPRPVKFHAPGGSDDSNDEYGSSKGSYPHVNDGYKPPQPYYQAPEENTEEADRTSEGAEGPAETPNDEEQMLAKAKPEPFFRPSRPLNQGRPTEQRQSHDDDEAESDTSGPNRPQNDHYDGTSPPEYDDRRRRVSSEPVYANEKGSYPKNTVQLAKVIKRRPFFGRMRPQMTSRMDTAAKTPVKVESVQQTPIDRMDNREQKEEPAEPEGRESKTESEVVKASQPSPASKKDFQSQRARLEALRQKFRNKASQRISAQSREAPEETGPEIDVQKIMVAAGQDHKPYENIGGYIEGNPDSPRRIDKYDSEAEFHSKLVDTKQTKDSRIRKLLRKRTQPPVTPEEMNAQPA